MLEFTMYLDDGTQVTIETGYDEYGLVISNMAYTFDAYGNLTDKQDLLAQSLSLASAESMSMGAGGGMAMMSMGAPDGPVNNNEDFTYDLLGNRKTRNTRKGYDDTYYKNSSNQYTRIHTDYNMFGMTEDVNLYYDDNGNLEIWDNNSVQFDYHYDYRNRLSKITSGVDTIAEYTYDALGRRIRKLVDGNATYYYYDTMGRVIAEYQTIDSNNVELARTFVYGNGIDEVLAMYIPEPNWYIDANEVAWLVGICDVWLCDVNDGCWDAAYNDYSDSIIDFRDYAKYLDDNPWTSNLPDGKERQYYYLHDALGSVMGLVGSQYKRESDREFYLYDVYGKPSGNESAVSGNPYGFTGRRYDSESGLYYYRARYYDSDMGRFTSIDPINYIDGLNLYEYVRSNPVINTDPLGLAIAKRIVALLNGQDFWGINTARTLQTVAADIQSGPKDIVSFFQEDADMNLFGLGRAAKWIINQQPKTCQGTKRGCCYPIVLVGHSNGGDGARKVCFQLQNKNYDVELLFLFDPIGKPWHVGPGGTEIVPSNVETTINVVQREATFTFLFFQLQGYNVNTATSIISNATPSDTTAWGSHLSIVHREMWRLKNAINSIFP